MAIKSAEGSKQGGDSSSVNPALLASKAESSRKKLPSPAKKSKKTMAGSKSDLSSLAKLDDLLDASPKKSSKHKSDGSVRGDRSVATKSGRKKFAKKRGSDDCSVQTESTKKGSSKLKKSSGRTRQGSSATKESTTTGRRDSAGTKGSTGRRDSAGNKSSTGRRDSGGKRDASSKDPLKRKKGRGRISSSVSLGGMPSSKLRSSSTPPVKLNRGIASRSTSPTPLRGRRRNSGARGSASVSGDARASTRSPKRSVKRVLSSSDFLQSPRADRFTLTTSLSLKSTSASAREARKETLNALVYKLKDSSLEEDLVGLFQRIELADGFPVQEKPSFGNNHITYDMERIIQNDPDVTTLRVDGDQRFKKVKKSLIIQFAESLRTNLHVTSVIIRDVGLEDRFLIALADSIRENFTLKTVVLSYNSFTNEGLVQFCNALSYNQSLRTVDLTKQRTPLEKHSERHALEALMENRYLLSIQFDVTTEKCKGLIKMIEGRNAKNPASLNYDKKLLNHFEQEAKNAEELFQLNLLEEKVRHLTEKEQTHLYNLVQIAELSHIESTEFKNSEDEKLDLHPEIAFTPAMMPEDGSFLDANFISNFLFEDPTAPGLIFALSHEFMLFRTFGPEHKARKTIVKKFVDALLFHFKSFEITKFLCKGAELGDDFIQLFCAECRGNSKMLPKLILLDFERNCVADDGMKAIASCIADKKTWRYLQTVKLDKQHSAKTGKKAHFSLDSEFALTKAMCVNISVLRLSLTIRHPGIRNKIENYVARNLDLMRQVRARVLDEKSDGQPTERNELEQIIDRVEENDPAVWDLGIEEADQRFISLNRRDVLKLAKGFTQNKFVTAVHLESVRLDDEFASVLGESLQINSAIRIINLDGNCISGRGIKRIFEGLVGNKTVTEVQLRGQEADSLTAEEEDAVQDLLSDNQSIVKVGLDLRHSASVSEGIAQILARNRKSMWEARRKSLD
eukprot:CAMPEP_0172450608 /NCGR_PEP_ID=MMETSP1065-20121228/8881_1 /TAXON_ID=265537 /ORGANISM="Amphiprora paludosa, Strain CCMP125" /LENGTH=964 /DNA_ID=CAMNT_0013202403 /DNA_START=38 /DNA_END=2932 /DNA_ORIENTATION=+